MQNKKKAKMTAEFIRWILFHDVMGLCLTLLFNKDIEISFPHRDYWIYQFVHNIRRKGRGFPLHIFTSASQLNAEKKHNSDRDT